MLDTFLSILIISVTQLVSLFGLIIGVGFLLGFLEKLSAKYFYRSFGKRGYMFTSYIGTPVHELGHVMMCAIFLHRIGRVQWFPMNSEEKVLGYVEHSFSRSSTYQKVGNFFVGIGPIVSGILSLILLLYYFLPDSYITFTDYIDVYVKPGPLTAELFVDQLLASSVLLKSLFSVNHLINPLFWLFMFLAISISTHIALSKSDINGAISGIVSILGVLIILNGIASFFDINSDKYIGLISGYNSYVLAFSSLAILFSLITLSISYISYMAKGIRLKEELVIPQKRAFNKIRDKLQSSLGFFQVATANSVYKEMKEEELYRFVLQLVKSLNDRKLQVNLICIKQEERCDSRFNELRRKYLTYVDIEGVPLLQFVGPYPTLFTSKGVYLVEDQYDFTYLAWSDVDVIYSAQDWIFINNLKLPTALENQKATEEFASMLLYFKARMVTK